MYLFSQTYQVMCGSLVNWKEWSFHSPVDVAVQKNSSDCGLFVCLWAHTVCCQGKLLPQKPGEALLCRLRNWLATVIFVNASQSDKRTFNIKPDCAPNMFSTFDKLKAKGKIEFEKPWEEVSLPTLRPTPPDKRHTLLFLHSFLNELHLATATKCGAYSCAFRKCVDSLMYQCELCREWYNLKCIRDTRALDCAEGTDYICPLHYCENLERRPKLNSKYKD